MSNSTAAAVWLRIDSCADTDTLSSDNDKHVEDIEVASEVLLLRTPASIGLFLSNMGVEGVVLLELVSESGSSSSPSPEARKIPPWIGGTKFVHRPSILPITKDRIRS